MRLITLGGLSLEGTAFTRVKPLLLLAYLALEGVRDRQQVAELFWLGSADPLNSLSAALKQLRQLGTELVEADKRQVWTRVSCDAKALLEGSEAGRYEEALGLYQGPFLSGIYLPGWSPELEEWVYGTREVLAQRVRDLLLRLGEREAARGELEQAARRAQAAYLLRGTVEPTPHDLRRLYTLLLAAEDPQAREVEKEALAYGLAFDLSAEEARRSLLLSSRQSARAHNLPSRSSSFVGRDLERAELVRLLQHARLVSLVGLAGVGKSRLALQVACEVLGQRGYPDGVYFIALETLGASGLITVSIAEALSITLDGTEDPLPQVMRFIGSKQMLLVLDNYEHLMDGATIAAELIRSCPNLRLLVTSRERLNLEAEHVMPLEGLLFPDAVPPTTPLVDHEAGRELRAEAGEATNGATREHPGGGWEGFDAIELFIERARLARPGFLPCREDWLHIRDICHLVSGSPLGIELAAAWLRLLTPAEIAAEIAKNLDFLSSARRDVHDRHKSLRAAFEHSWGLLSPLEQEVLRKLSVFRGGFKREAAAEVAGATLSVLASLVDKSLLRVTPGGRYDRHPLLYQYSQEKLAQHAEEQAETQKRHASFFFRFLRERNRDMRGEGQRQGLRGIAEELENLRVAWGWAARELSLRDLQEAVEPLTLFYDRYARYQEGIDLLQEARARLDEGDPQHQLALGTVLVGQAFLYQWASRYEEASQLAQQGLDILRPLGDAWGMMMSLETLGYITGYAGDFSTCMAYVSEALALARAQGNLPKTIEFLSDKGLVSGYLWRIEDANAYLAEATALTRNLGKHTTTLTHLHNLGFYHLYHQPKEAQLAFQQGVALARELGHHRYTPLLLYGLGIAAYEVGDYQQAKEACLQVLEITKEAKQAVSQVYAFAILGRVAGVLQDPVKAEDYLLRSLSIGKSIEAMPIQGVSVAVAYLAELWLRQRRHEQIAELLAAILHHPFANVYAQRIAQEILTNLQLELPEEMVTRAFERGKSTGLEEVVANIVRQEMPGQ